MIGVEKVRDLTLSRSGGDERSSHISAASSLVRKGHLLFVVADDELQLGVFPGEGKEHGYLVPILPGHLPAGKDEKLKKKPDLEALTETQWFPEHDHGALLVVGSGSGPEHNRGSVLPLDENGHPGNDHHEFDLTTLYDAISADVGKVNVEGAVNWDEHLVLLNRGNDPEAKNASVFLDAERALEDVAANGRITGECVVEVRSYELGQHRGVDLCFSDASPLGDGRIVFGASTEDDAVGTEGSALGIIDERQKVVFIEPIDKVMKVEGVSARLKDNGIEVLMVTDADDPSSPSPLLRALLNDKS
jgi:hypothetical protein